MANEADRFVAQLTRFVEKTAKTTERIEDLTKQEFKNQFIEKTPVKTGRAKRGWKFVPDSRAAQSVQDVKTPIFRINAIVLQNDVFYTPTVFTYPGSTKTTAGLEGGRSPQAPNGMVGPGVEEILNKWDIIVARARTGS